MGLSAFKEFVHFGLTSQDINNTAVPMSIRDAMQQVYYPETAKLIRTLEYLADEWRDVSMLAKTHGQPASPTRLGKEIMVYVHRLNEQMVLLKSVPHAAKFGVLPVILMLMLWLILPSTGRSSEMSLLQTDWVWCVKSGLLKFQTMTIWQHN